MKHVTPLASRGGSTSPLGKLDGWLPRTRIETDVKARFEARATAAAKAAGFRSKPSAELVRDMVRVAALGPEEAKRLFGEGVLVVTRLIVEKSDE